MIQARIQHEGYNSDTVQLHLRQLPLEEVALAPRSLEDSHLASEDYDDSNFKVTSCDFKFPKVLSGGPVLASLTRHSLRSEAGSGRKRRPFSAKVMRHWMWL